MVSEWRLGGIKRRDARHIKEDVRPPGGSKKNTKKWCRGVVGREHKPECKPWPSSGSWKVLACTSCGKHLDYYWPASREPTPSWAK